jgi:hypothetical protein
MRAIATALLLSCKPDAVEPIDIAVIDKTEPAAALDLAKVIHVDTPQLSRCADPVRPMVPLLEPGKSRVGVVVRAIGKQGHALSIRTMSVAPVSSGSFTECVTRVLDGTGEVHASADYALTVRIHLCVQSVNPNGAP